MKNNINIDNIITEWYDKCTNKVDFEEWDLRGNVLWGKNLY